MIKIRPIMGLKYFYEVVLVYSFIGCGSIIHHVLADRQVEEAPKTTKDVKHSKPKRQVNKPKRVFNIYLAQINKLKSSFDVKEKNTRDLIEKRFPSHQLTNSKFNQIIDKSVKLFNQKLELTKTLIDSTTVYSAKVEEEIKSNIDILNEINGKLDSLSDELLIRMSEDKNDEVKSVLSDIDEITDSIKDYEQ